jgi:peptide/nickel transport system substrate-binding protein
MQKLQSRSNRVPIARTLAIAALTVIATGAAFANGVSAVADDATTISAQAQARDSLRIALRADASTLDGRNLLEYAARTVGGLVFSSLVYIAHDGSIQADAAESWVVEDGRIFTFTLRPNVVFHTGRALTASDVVYTFESVRDPEVASGYAGNFPGLLSVEAVDELTVQFEFDSPTAVALSNIALVGIVAEDYTTDLQQARTRPVGTGPFRLVSWERNEQVVLERHDDYHGDTPRLRQITFRVIPDGAVRATNLMTGEIDVASEVPAPFVLRFRQEGTFGISAAQGAYWAVFINTLVEPFDDVNVRRALLHAIDRDELNLLLWEGLAESIPPTLILPANWAHEPNVASYDYDASAAERLLAEAGYAGGVATQIMSRPDDLRVRFHEVLQNQLSRVGITASVEVMEASVQLQMSRDKLVPLQGAQLGIRLDPAIDLRMTVHSSGSLNFGYENARVDELIEASEVTLDVDERRALLAEAQRILAEEVAVVPLFALLDFQAHHPELREFETNPSGFPSVYHRVARYAYWAD